MGVEFRKAKPEDIDGIRRVCIDGWWATYADIYLKEYIEEALKEYYSLERITREVTNPQGWNGWYVAVDDDEVVGAGGGGIVAPGVGDLFVIYLDPKKRGKGVGSKLLEIITQEMRQQGAREQWVTVTEGNQKGIPFYKARGFVEQERIPSWRHSQKYNYYSLRMKRAL